VHPPGLALADLPRIDAVLLSHDHYDHCDTATLGQLARNEDITFITPLRHRDLLSAAGAKKIIELDWWQSHSLAPGANITFTPSKHWSNRFGTPRNHRLWGGFFLTLGEPQRSSPPSSKRVWFVGDSGFDPAMIGDVRRRCGPPDLALVPIGAYEPRWFMAPMHINPAEAVQVHQLSGAGVSVAMHWGTFQLTDEAREEPMAALAVAKQNAHLTNAQFRALAPGESLILA
jgi:L-ascorbate metabolism protein UlaG (beta-lactamase superfamily)